MLLLASLSIEPFAFACGAAPRVLPAHSLSSATPEALGSPSGVNPTLERNSSGGSGDYSAVFETDRSHRVTIGAISNSGAHSPSLFHDFFDVFDVAVQRIVKAQAILEMYAKDLYESSYRAGTQELMTRSRGAGTSHEDLEWVMKINRTAYRIALNQVVSEITKIENIPIVVRSSTFAAQSFQFLNYATKPKEVVNKSSTLPGIDGFVPCNSYAGKIGNQLRSFWIAHCATHDANTCLAGLNACLDALTPEDSFPPVCVVSLADQWRNNPVLEAVTQEFKQLKDRIEWEKGQIHKLLEGSSYRCIPMVINEFGVRKIPVFSDPWANGIKTELFSEPYPELTAYVLAQSEGNPITADTDLFLVGQAKLKHAAGFSLNNSHFTRPRYSDAHGYYFGNTDQVIAQLNAAWAKITANGNTIFQHADEVSYGLNLIDDILIGYDPAGASVEFDLRWTIEGGMNAKRNEELKAFAHWLAIQSEYSILHLPEDERERDNPRGGLKRPPTLVSEDYRKLKDYMAQQERVISIPVQPKGDDSSKFVHGKVNDSCPVYILSHCESDDSCGQSE